MTFERDEDPLSACPFTRLEAATHAERKKFRRAQEGAFFPGSYRQYCCLPLYCFCGNIALWTQLRDAKGDASSGTVEALSRIVAAVLEGALGKAFGSLHEQIQSGQVQTPRRRFEDFTYRTKRSWSSARQVVGKAEVLDKGANPRFIVSNLSTEDDARFASASLYEKFYCVRGEIENRIKEAQQDLFADRTSTGWMASNQLRLWLPI